VVLILEIFPLSVNPSFSFLNVFVFAACGEGSQNKNPDFSFSMIFDVSEYFEQEYCSP
jgi:hypothetical protein